MTKIGDQRFRTLSLRDRFNMRFDRGDGCWNWIGQLNRSGYGTISDKNKKCTASRVAYELFVGAVPAHLDVCHRCDNPRCVRPDHLFLGTHRDNMQDMLRKGRGHGLTTRRKLDETGVREIRRRHAAGERAVDIATHFRVSRQTVYRIARGRIWKDVARAEVMA